MDREARRQHRVYHRKPRPERPKNRDSVVCYAEGDARGFSTMAGQVGRPRRSP